jgi:hypothetical protein
MYLTFHLNEGLFLRFSYYPPNVLFSFHLLIEKNIFTLVKTILSTTYTTTAGRTRVLFPLELLDFSI